MQVLESIQSVPAAPEAKNIPTFREEQLRLGKFNRRRLNPALPSQFWTQDLRQDFELQMLEGTMIERERRQVAPQLAQVPQDAEGFMRWFADLERTAPGQGDPLFPWLAETASQTEMKWFLTQEVAGEAGFDDLVALTQVKFPVQSKLEMARNYWDEMGRGAEKGMHGPMLGRLAQEMKIDPASEDIITEALALANLLVGFAANRRYAYQSIGALGAIELTAPGRAKLVYEGLKRLGFKESAQYYLLHSSLDVKHSQEWNAHVIAPLVQARPEVIPAIAEGAWLRLEFGARCFARYREFLFRN